MSTDTPMNVDEPSDGGSSREASPKLPESLIAGRQRRSTAGNRLAQLLQQEQPDDIDLLFEETGEDDGDFEAKHESDIDLGSSSDEEDKPQEQDELAGEKELQQEEQASKKKRKAGASYPGQKELDKLVKRQQALRNKRVTIQEPDQSKESSTAPSPGPDQAPRARKKSERISWIPTLEDQPSRQSSRRQTVANKQMIHERMKESNERRLKVIAAMNEASLRKKEQKVELTQEMRLERAKKVEHQNKKSLNKWQEAEEARLAAQRAKLAALHNRKIEGPYIRFYSGRAEWGPDGRLVGIGKRKLVQEVPEVAEVPEKSEVPKKTPENENDIDPKKDTADQSQPDGDVVMDDAPQDNAPQDATPELKNADPTTVPAIELPTGDAPPVPNQPTEPPNPAQIETVAAVPPSDADYDDDTHHQIAEQLQTDLDAALPPAKPSITSQAYICLEGFKKEASNREFQSKILFPHNRGPLPKPDRPLCVTTSLPARFKDPSTGLPAHCEKQILIPNHGVLYCSEACRRRDRDTKSHPIPISGSLPLHQQQRGGFGSWNTPPLSPRLGYMDNFAPPNLIAPTSPTTARSIPLSRTTSSPGDHTSFSPPSDPIPLHRRSVYEMSYPSMSAPSSPTNSSGVHLPSKRPPHLPRNNTFTSVTSLAHSPANSSFTRPLPPLHNPFSSSFSSSPRSIDLVTPISSVTSQPAGLAHTGAANGTTSEQMYEKKAIPSSGHGQGSLKKLFNFDGMRAPPQQPMRSTPMVSRAVSPAPMASNISRAGSPTPGSVSDGTKLKSTWTDLY
ncbi:Vacuolar protein-sorting-associated protein [Drechslerella dactyloides]|uniref:Vacuolar protein-sorting-associated protein n=1 Tax=Drechslerella dactyloides TaxID=74499 RepID=A0AAD6J3M9_DREDA|nr:Vacuolar protein-sorting-associated protein [Drechslerella dactyloides]